MPTLLHLTGQPIPEWVEGVVLPPYNPNGENTQRGIFAAEARSQSDQFGEIPEGSFMIIKNGYKLTYYTGYAELKDHGELVELFHVDDDPEEMDELSSSHPEITAELKQELLDTISEANQKSMDYR